jgi:hypothetical protein
MRTMMKFLMTASVAVGAVASAQSAQAALVSSWDWNASSVWGTTTYTTGGGTQTVDNSAASPIISWGVGSNDLGTNPSLAQSYLEVSGSVGQLGNTSDDLTTYVGSVATPLLNGCSVVACQAGAVITHGNNTLFRSSAMLDTTELVDTLVLKIPGGSSAPGFPKTLTLNVKFTETPNIVGGTCDGDPLFGGSPCPDRFLIGNAADLLQSFVLDDYKYTFFLALDPNLGGNGDVTLNGDGTFTIRTKEPGITTLKTNVGIFAEKIPEPANMSLLVLGLIGMGLARRRRAA